MRTGTVAGCAWVVGGLTLGSAAAPAGAAMTHRYSFNDGTANDSIGGLNGTLVNGPAVTGGQLVFSPAVNNGGTGPASGQYVNLPGNPVKTRSLTVEVWAAPRVAVSWQRFLDLGSGANGVNAGTNTGFGLFCPYGATTSTGAVNGPIGQITLSGNANNYVVSGTAAAPAVNVEHQFVYTLSPDTGVEQVFVDGTAVATAGATLDASVAVFSTFYIGRSNFTADPYLTGTVDDFRTYDAALTPAQVSASYAAGPNAGLPVPEPASAAGVVAAGAGLLARRRRRRQ